MRFSALGFLVVASLPLVACTYDDGPNTNKRYLELGIDAPEKDEVVICHAYGCKMKTPYRFTSANIAEIKREMKRVKRNDSPAEERRAIAYAIGLMERQVGAAIGIKDKRTASTNRRTRQASSQCSNRTISCATTSSRARWARTTCSTAR
jgi:hypothetical protein